MKKKHSKGNHSKHSHVYSRRMTNILGVVGERTPNLLTVGLGRTADVRVGEVVVTIGNSEYVKKISNLPSYRATFKGHGIVMAKDNRYLPKVHFASNQFAQAMVSATKDLDIKLDPIKL